MSTGVRIRVLIADDHVIARMGVETIINTQPDMTVVAEAANGVQAVELHRKYRPDVTLMDMRMPGLSGQQAISAIRVEKPDARIIALSSYGGDEDVRRAVTSGACGYLTKDVLHDELILAIHTVYRGETYLPRPIAAALEAGARSANLSVREMEVLSLIVKGLGNKHIAHQLNIAEPTVKNHVQSILEKLAVDDRTQAATAAIRRGFIHL